MKKSLLVALVVVGLGSVAACNRDTTPGSPNRVNPPTAPPRAQSSNPPGAPGAPSTQSAPHASNVSPRPGQGTETQVAQLSFDSVDTNKDGVITQNEALAVPGLDFASADKDNNHSLSHQEFDAAMAKTRPGG